MRNITPKIIMVMFVGSYGVLASPITLNTSVLPSSQGWNYSANGLHAGTVEADIFSVDGAAIHMDSMGLPSSRAGGSIVYRQPSVLNSSLPTILEWTSRTVEYERAVWDSTFGFLTGFRSGNLNYGVGITTDQISLFNGNGYTYLSINATEYHTYRIETIAGASLYEFYVDGVLQTSASARFGTSADDVYFGDGTGGANSITDITALEFSQIPEPMSASLILLVFPLIILRRNLCSGPKNGSGRLYLHLIKVFRCLYLQPTHHAPAQEKWL